MNPRVAILGAGGHGRDLRTIAQDCGYDVVLLDDDTKIRPILKPTSHAAHGLIPWVIGVYNPSVRREIDRRISGPDNIFAADLIHPTSTGRVGSSDGGLVIGPATHVGTEVLVGRHVHVGPGCTLTRCDVGSYTTIAPGVNIAGDVKIGEGCLVGVGATISNLVTIGDRCVIGAGSVVVDDVPDGATVKGVPAR